MFAKPTACLGTKHWLRVVGNQEALCDIGMLQEVKAGREKLFVHAKLLRLLTTDSNEFSPYTQ